MSKKKDFTFDEEDVEIRPVPVEVNKLPIDSTGAGRTLTNFQDIPVEMLHPFSLKGGQDYSRHSAVLSEQFVKSIKKYGILETLIVRKSPIKPYFYEIIAGESRWDHAKEAGEKTVPCRVMDLDDEAARNIFHLTNLLHRDLTPRDKVHGWYDFYTRMQGREIDDAALNAAVAEEQETVLAMTGGKGLSLRTIQRYVKMHDLIDAWLDKLDAEEISSRVGYQIAFLPADIQKELLDYKVTEKKVLWLRDVCEGKLDSVSWDDSIIKNNFVPIVQEPKPKIPEKPLTKEEREVRRQTRKLNKQFKEAVPGMTAAIRERLRPQDYSNASNIIAEALDLYYKQKTE